VKILTVSEVNGYTKTLLDEDMLLSDIYVAGEISNLKRHTSGHMYFTLKDASGQLSAAMFKWQCRYLHFAPTNGMRVVAHGKITLYEAGGQYQMVVSSLQPDGIGALYAAYEQLKEKLEAEGLFETGRKRPLPEMPMRVGAVTSKTGAAFQDILNIITRRWPVCTVVLAPVMVQGDAAPAQIADAVRRMNAQNACDVMIVGRGGGSIEDLWAFNDEEVVRTVAASAIPVISAVGHETDFTLCDFAADMRAPTPSAAAELAVPDLYSVRSFIGDASSRMSVVMDLRITRLRERLVTAASRRCFSSPQFLCEAKAQRLDMAQARIAGAMNTVAREARERLASVCGRLTALNPLAVLARGYSVVTSGGAIVSSTAQLSPGDRISIQLSDGTAAAEVINEQDDIQ